MQASRDQNQVPTILGTLRTDGLTPIRAKADATTHRLSTVSGSNGSNNGPTVDTRDENNVPAFMATSADDNVTPVPVYITQNGSFLIDYN